MERIVLAARLQFGMFTVGAEHAQIDRVCRRWLLRIAVKDKKERDLKRVLLPLDR